jgi:transcription elongation factor GreA
VSVEPDYELPVTPEGFERLRADLEHLVTHGRMEIAARLRHVRQTSASLDESTEYQAILLEQERLEQRIVDLQWRIASARVVSSDDLPADIAAVGRHVRLHDLGSDETMDFRLVGPAERDPTAGRISNVSPVGSAVVGRRQGETVEVVAPAGPLVLKLVEVRA